VKVRKLREGSISARALDVLETDGGWLTDHAIAAAVGCALETVRRKLYLLKREGRVSLRTVRLSHGNARSEWKECRR